MLAPLIFSALLCNPHEGAEPAVLNHQPDGLALLRVLEPKTRGPAYEVVTLGFSQEDILGPFDPGFDWDELVPSWNLPSPVAGITLDAAITEPRLETKWYQFGSWTINAGGSRMSIKDQKDDLAEVQTDTLVTELPQRKVWLRIKVGGYGEGSLRFPFLTLSFRNSKAGAQAESPNKRAWGKTIDVPQRSQMSYEGGIVWCSPTCVSMVLSHWANVLKRPELNVDVPEVAASVNDPNWPGTGNWPFNTAFAGSFPGIRAYVARLGGVREIEDWIAAKIPVTASVSLALLKGKPKKEANDGHLVVVVGFTKDGDPIFNDPGRSKEVRQIYKREHFEAAWKQSGNTVYLIYPEKMKPPPNRLKHWAD